MAERAALPTLNETVVKQTAVAVLKAVKGGALHDLTTAVRRPNTRTPEEPEKAMSKRCIEATNMADVWNASEHIRSATTLTQAKAAAKKFASTVRHI